MGQLFIVRSGRVLEPTPIGSPDVGAQSNDLRRKAHYDLNKDLWLSKALCALASSIS